MINGGLEREVRSAKLAILDKELLQKRRTSDFNGTLDMARALGETVYTSIVTT
jgi:hypothetical protein